MEVRYIDHMGDDLRVANAARVSFAKESSWENYTETTEPDHYGLTYDLTKYRLRVSDKSLINYLATHNHWTPFSHCVVTLVEKVPLFVARQRFKHMVGFTYNEVSRRYVSDEPEFFVPTEWREKAENKKQGSGGKHPLDDKISLGYNNFLDSVCEYYDWLIEQGVAPEQARMVLPQSMYTEYYVTGSLAAFARAYKLRIDSHAQVEIQDLAKKWDEVIRPLYPQSWSALVD